MVESLSWEHGVLLGAALKSEATSAAEFKGKLCLHCNNRLKRIVRFTSVACSSN